MANVMINFNQLITAYLAAHPNILPPDDNGEDAGVMRESPFEWGVYVRHGGEIVMSTVCCEELLGWLWIQQSVKQKS